MRTRAKLAVAVAAVIPMGCVSGLALAGYVQSGSFDQYRYTHMAERHSAPSEEPVALRASDLAYRAPGEEQLASIEMR